MRRARGTFLTGLLAVIPLSLTVFITLWTFDKVTGLIPKLLQLVPVPWVDELLNNRFSLFGIRVLGLFLIVFAIYLVGLVARNVIGRKIFSVVEQLVLKVPMVSTIYSTLQQIGRAIVRGGGTGMFRQVVLIEYPRSDVYVIGFLTAPASEECNRRAGREMLSIFVPTTPNPTSGFLLFLPREDVTVLDMSVMEGMRLVISGGAVHPTYAPPPDRPAE